MKKNMHHAVFRFLYFLCALFLVSGEESYGMLSGMNMLGKLSGGGTGATGVPGAGGPMGGPMGGAMGKAGLGPKGPKAPTANSNATPVPKAAQDEFNAAVLQGICEEMAAIMPTGPISGSKKTLSDKKNAILGAVKKVASSADITQKIDVYANCIINALEPLRVANMDITPASAQTNPDTSQSSPSTPAKIESIPIIKDETSTILSTFCAAGIAGLKAGGGSGPAKGAAAAAGGIVGKAAGKGKRGAPAAAPPAAANPSAPSAPGGGLTPDKKDKSTAATDYQALSALPNITSAQKITYLARCISVGLGTGAASVFPLTEYKPTLFELCGRLIQALPDSEEKNAALASKVAAFSAGKKSSQTFIQNILIKMGLKTDPDKIKFEKYSQCIIQALSSSVSAPAATAATSSAKSGGMMSFLGGGKKKGGSGKPQASAPGAAPISTSPDQKDRDVQNLADMCTEALTNKKINASKKQPAMDQQNAARSANSRPDILTAYAKCISIMLGTGEAGAPPPPPKEDKKDNKGDKKDNDNDDDDDTSTSKKGKKGKAAGKGGKAASKDDPSTSGKSTDSGKGKKKNGDDDDDDS